jgi:hypothetical protein
MIFKIKMSMGGEFPGSPDHDYFIVPEKIWSKVRDILYPRYLDPEYDIMNARNLNQEANSHRVRVGTTRNNAWGDDGSTPQGATIVSESGSPFLDIRWDLMAGVGSSLDSTGKNSKNCVGVWKMAEQLLPAKGSKEYFEQKMAKCVFYWSYLEPQTELLLEILETLREISKKLEAR